MSLEVALKLLKVGVCRSSSGNEFNSTGLAWEKARSPNFVELKVEHS